MTKTEAYKTDLEYLPFFLSDLNACIENEDYDSATEFAENVYYTIKSINEYQNPCQKREFIMEFIECNHVEIWSAITDGLSECQYPDAKLPSILSWSEAPEVQLVDGKWEGHLSWDYGTEECIVLSVPELKVIR